MSWVSSQNLSRLVNAAKALGIRQKERQFGAIAVKKRFVNQSVIQLAMDEQNQDIKNKRKVRMIGDILVGADLMTAEQRNYILKLQKRIHNEGEKPRTPSPAQSPQPSAPSPEDAVPGQKTSAAADPSTQDPAGSPEEKQSTQGPDLMAPEIIDHGIKLEIAKDHMSAYITKTRQFNSDITPSELKEALSEKGIVMGIVEEKMIQGFIRSSGFKTKSFMVARGITPIEGKDARVEFFFNTDYLKAGGLTDDGTIDFKDRGKVPHVEEGTVLAEKIPMVEARKGHSIYGDEIETVPGRDVPVKLGKGARLSEDGYKVLAAVKGFPKYTLAGQIFVHQEYVAEGDVDFETGHITYDGNVTIKGRIKSGFKVKGSDIKAMELDGGHIESQGNIIISGGINEGKIYSRGNVYAKFIHKSEIVCMGDVVVEKEIVDSDIECSGNCRTENGKLISSKVTAKMGVKARNIGSEMATPNTIKVGYDAFLEKELETNETKTESLKKQMRVHEEKKEEYKQENLALQQQITDLAHVQDRSQLEEREITAQLIDLEKSGGQSAQIDVLKQKIAQLKENAKTAEESLEKCFDRSEEIEALMEKEDEKKDALDDQVDLLIEEKNNLIEWAKDNPGKAEVIVEGAITPENIIRGKHCEKRVPEEIRHARFHEVLCSTDDGRDLNIYEIQVGQI
jgi:uncharacterized protein (DUF342 family)